MPTIVGNRCITYKIVRRAFKTYEDAHRFMPTVGSRGTKRQ